MSALTRSLAVLSALAGCNLVVDLPAPGGGAGGAGGSGGAGGAATSCDKAADCQLSEPCKRPACVAHKCVAVDVEPGAPCDGGTCDQNGACVP